ncbi:Hepatocyte nuclear factor 3-gamma [Larimichthys crocea]|uniref:Hepatocyte nuclear factor 3-gamma n=1 Tax=Larimichthys crocea TaxID=215358 RepID=A0A6G0HEK5_LARCR|nr:Hepatocyte nuclear factor 3-gamma [Larimichthys crocea]
MTMEHRSSCTGGRVRLGLSFTIDYLLFNKGVKGSKEEATGSRTAEQTVDNMLNHQNPKPKEVEIHSAIQEKQLQRSEAETKERKVKEEEGDESNKEGEEEVTTTRSISNSPEKSADKPNQSYIALISKAILASEGKKLLLCDIYQWIMDHYPYFKSKDKNWRNSVRHNLSLNDCFIKAGRSENGKGHFWAIHPSNYQNFLNGDYHCRRARRRVRRIAGQFPLPSISSPYHPVLAPTEQPIGAALRSKHFLCPAWHPDSTGHGPACSLKWGFTRACVPLYPESEAFVFFKRYF